MQNIGYVSYKSLLCAPYSRCVRVSPGSNQHQGILALRCYRHALLAKNIIRHSATTKITRTVSPSMRTPVIMLTGTRECG
ncbi:hypothetical protein ARMGADRAFT_339205 [Armillaria gallica]|uniref:Uncharacterized protein n=1 Tax=Armillaria gallica TaxID=47427 RepID=A0A2H3DM29_ARMGA|nr:hypothetical protein ARMGADRAFT_339205 [Armillaria gallica]